MSEEFREMVLALIWLGAARAPQSKLNYYTISHNGPEFFFQKLQYTRHLHLYKVYTCYLPKELKDNKQS
jgi:hypothetical protein